MKKTTWILDSTHSELGFKIKHLMITNVSGRFTEFEAEAKTEDEDFSTAQVEAKIKTASINTNNAQRDGHLRTSDFLEAETYPEIIFRSTRIEKEDNENFFVYGNLTMKGITKPVKLNVEYSGVTKDPWGGERVGLVISGKINRSEWVRNNS